MFIVKVIPSKCKLSLFNSDWASIAVTFFTGVLILPKYNIARKIPFLHPLGKKIHRFILLRRKSKQFFFLRGSLFFILFMSLFFRKLEYLLLNMSSQFEDPFVSYFLCDIVSMQRLTFCYSVLYSIRINSYINNPSWFNVCAPYGLWIILFVKRK